MNTSCSCSLKDKGMSSFLVFVLQSSKTRNTVREVFPSCLVSVRRGKCVLLVSVKIRNTQVSLSLRARNT